MNWGGYKSFCTTDPSTWMMRVKDNNYTYLTSDIKMVHDFAPID